LTESILDTLSWFPYEPRLYQERAVKLAAGTYAKKTVGMLSADCGIGKTIAVLSGYLAARGDDPDYRLFVTTRTHSQSKVFEEELEVLKRSATTQQIPITATSMVSRVHLCPNKHKIDSESSTGFMHGCARMIRTGQCTEYWNFYKRSSSESKTVPREKSLETVDDLLLSGIVTREVVENVAHDDGVCPYELLRWCARNSRVIIGPYTYLFKERVRDAILASIKTPLYALDLLVDEAHNLPDHVLDSEVAVISGEDLKWLRDNRTAVSKETGISWLVEAVDFLWETLMVSLDKMSKARQEITLDRWDVVPRFVEVQSLQLLLDRTEIMEDADSVPTETPLDRIAEFLCTGHKTLESEDWHVTAEIQRRWKEHEISYTNAELRIRPLNAAGLIAPVLRGARSSVLMSGTFRPVNLYAGLLGVKGALTEDLASPYPKGTRMVLVDNEISTKYTERSPKLWRAIATRIQTALESMPAQKSVLIAFPSYDIMNEVLSYNIDCGFRERLVESRGARIEELKEQVERNPTAVFLVYGGKFSEGVDLVSKGHSLIDMIIGVGIPFSPPTSYQRAIQDWYEGKFGRGAGYYYSSVVPSVRKVVQLAGRLRRSPEDWGVVILLDKRFKKYIEMFGDDAINDLWPYKNVEEMTSAIKTFLDVRGEEINAR